eukprot:4240093-Pleurochrysis_carterae.AAC.1
MSTASSHVARYEAREARTAVHLLAEKLPLRSGVFAIAVDQVIVREAALSLVGAVVAVSFARIASAAVVRRTCVFRMKRVARELGFAFCDREFAFILSGKLVR